MDLTHAIPMPKAWSGLLPQMSIAFSPLLQKQIGILRLLFASKRERRVSQRQFAVKAASSGEYRFGSGGPNMVDANMIVLRKRILDLKMQEKNYKTPEEYMEREKDWYPGYHARVFMVMEWLQSALINTRPIVAICVLSLISASVSLAIIIVLATALNRLSEMTTPILSTLKG
eukprot:PITA_24755